MRLEGHRFGQYRFLRLLRAGGMGEVYLADDERLHRRVAIKVIWTDISHYPDPNEAKEAARLFLREAQAIAQLDHMHILPVYDSGEESIDGLSFMYMVMPFRPEGSLADWLYKRGNSQAISLWDIERIVRQAASALQHAHNHQIIHQDVKPSNFLMRGDAEYPNQLNLQLSDFGIAKFMTTTSESQVIRGTPAYMAPELWNGHPVAATDQYALAVMVYELLTGRSPFVGHNNQQLWYQHSYSNPIPPGTFNSKISHDLDAILLCALAKNPQQRFPSISEFAQAFRKALLNSLNVYETLTISPYEAQGGTRRLAQSPRGEQLSINIPAGTRDGQVLRFERQGKTAGPGGPVGSLIITIDIDGVEEPTALANFAAVERALPGRSAAGDTVSAEHTVRPPRGKHALILSLAFLLIIGGVLGVFSILRPSLPDNMGITATSPSHAATVRSHNTDVARSTMTSIGQANASSTANAHATATQVANVTATANANATATRIANVTATANTNATATQIVNLSYANAIAGTTAVDDSLQANSTNNWDTTYASGYGGCTFTQGAYHSIVQKNTRSPCFAQATNFSNFAYECQMTIVAGDQGGIAFRANKDNGAFYYFHINISGVYGLDIYSNNSLSKSLASGFNPAIKTALNQVNVLTVVAIGNTLTLYVNKVKVASATDPTYTSGQIGVVAEDTGNPSDMVFSNARVWTK